MTLDIKFSYVMAALIHMNSVNEEFLHVLYSGKFSWV